VLSPVLVHLRASLRCVSSIHSARAHGSRHADALRRVLVFRVVASPRRGAAQVAEVVTRTST
jgi:hypothetical protein